MNIAQFNALHPLRARKQYNGCADRAVRFLSREQSMDGALWKKFVDQFREQIDGTNRGWRGEFWGKTMRGAALLYEYTQDEALYRTLTDSVRDMLTVAEPDGRVSSFTRDTEFTAWDIWCRKYVLLGMEYYYDICRDEALKKKIVTYISRAADYILARVGKESEGKKPITACCYSWTGLNSASILEPMVWLYRLTGEQRYLDFSTYIVELGASHMFNIFEMAYENKIYPYQYGVEKAYEMISCFEGLVEYYRVTGIEKYKIAAVNFGKALLDSEVTVIGSCGCTHELFDHSKARQTAYYEGIMQETCVTVTWMKLCGQLLRLTGERVFADAIEHSFFNAYLGAMNTEHRDTDAVAGEYMVNSKTLTVQNSFLPFDSYCPLTPTRRGRKTGGLQIFSDATYYGCCAAIGAAGVGVYLRHAVMLDADGIAVNFYENGEVTANYKGDAVTLRFETAYPADGKIKLTVFTEKPLRFALKLRVPAWSERIGITAEKAHTLTDGYVVLVGEWSGESEIVLELDMRIRVTRPEKWETDVLYIKNHYTLQPPTVVYHEDADDLFVSLSRGPLTLAVDSRMGKDAISTFDFCEKDGEIAYRVCDAAEHFADIPCVLCCAFQNAVGEEFRLIDYASAGKDWASEIAAWLPIKK